MYKKLLNIVALSFASIFAASADEGMWMPNLLKLLNEKEMIAAGMRISADDIYNPNKTSLKDAVVQFGNGCTGEIISGNGLIVTNHHCGFGEIQSHSTLQNNYLRDGFWAKNQSEELPNPGLTASIVIKIEDVTKEVLEGVQVGMPEAERDKLITKNSAAIREKYLKGGNYKGFIRPFYYGTQFYLYVMEVFEDVRLVGAPPSAIGKFGGDTDNWAWPRHTGDFSLFRIYADRNTNKPAPYSTANTPYKPKFHFPISIAGVKENDFTLVMGFPGRTQQYLTSYAVKLTVEKSNTPKIALRAKRLKAIAEASAKDPLVQIQYADKYASIANYWKKWEGENKGIKRLNTIAEKQQLEKDFITWSTKDAYRFKLYAEVLENLRQNYIALEDFITAFEFHRDAVFGAEVLAHLTLYEPFLKADEAKRKTLADNLLKSQKAFYKDFNLALEKELFAICMAEYAKVVEPKHHNKKFTELRSKYKDNFKLMAEVLYKKSAFADSTTAQKFITSSYSKQTKLLERDELYQLSNAFFKFYSDSLVPRYRKIQLEVDLNSRLFVQGLMEMQKDRKFYPDANFTLRVAYGKVQPYKPYDGATYKHFTTIDGIMEKENPAVEEFQVPQRLKELYNKKDYAIYADASGTVPVAFIATNHTTGGNSGSPVLNAQGHLIGVNFDRSWESTMSDIDYDASICRNIALDTRYLLFVIDKVGGAGYLLQEMTIVK